jgi:small subunit ribosomal protein S21
LHSNLKGGRLNTMLIIPIKEGENIDRALKRFKRKFDKTGTKRSLQTRKQFEKPSVKRRAQIQKAQYIQGLRDAENL